MFRKKDFDETPKLKLLELVPNKLKNFSKALSVSPLLPHPSFLQQQLADLAINLFEVGHR